MSRSSSFDIPTARKKSTKIPSFTGRHRAVPLVSSALQGDGTISSGRGFRPADWNIYAAQASDGDNSLSDGEVAGPAAYRDDTCRSASSLAYLEVGETGGSTFRYARFNRFGTLYQRLRADGAALFDAQGQRSQARSFRVFHDLFQRRRKQEKARAMTANSRIPV